MEDYSFFFIIFLFFSLASMTIYSINVGFGKSYSKLRDPFEEHED